MPPHTCIDLGGRVEPGLGAELAGAVEQVDLLGVEEERLVEAAEPLEAGRAARARQAPVTQSTRRGSSCANSPQ